MDTQDIPEGFPQSFETSRVNANVLIHTGEFLLSKGDVHLLISGAITFEWLPTIQVRFSGSPNGEESGHDVLIFFMTEQSLFLSVNDEIFGEAMLTSFENQNVTGRLVHEKCLGNREALVERFTFSIPNLKNIAGTPIQWEKTKFSSKRIEFGNDEFLVTLEQNFHFETIQKELVKSGGYAIQYYGEVRRKTGMISYYDVLKLSEALNSFFSFINGRRTAILFVKGKINDENIWENYVTSTVDSYYPVTSWYHKGHQIDIQALWINFWSIWSDEQQKDNLRNVINWYLESNCNKVHIENCIILCQAALELLYNWQFVELNKGKERDSIYKKMHKILKKIKVTSSIPESLRYLKTIENIEFQDEEDEVYRITTGPNAIIEIRNALIHGNKWRRANLDKIVTDSRIDAWILGNWYIELSILQVLKYQGQYNNRTVSIRKDQALN